MEGLIIPDESSKRPLEARKLLGDDFEVLIAEEWQDAVPHPYIQKVDLMKLESADIILADFYNSGMECKNNELKTVLCRGTNQEVAYTKALNRYTQKKRPIIQIIRQSTYVHPFDKEGDIKQGFVTKNCRSLEEACAFIREKYGRKHS
jgi:hypothetical protein